MTSRSGMPTTSVCVPDGRIAISDRGSGQPIVLLHGGTGTSEYDWECVREQLETRHRTVTVDLRAHGGSVHGGENFGMVRFGLDLVHVLRRLGLPRAVLIGFSVGGNTVLKLVARHPGIAAAIVTIGAAARGDAGRVEQIMSGPWPHDLVALRHAVADRPHYWRHLRGMLAHDWAQHLNLTDAELARIDCPALVCHGDRDRVQQLDEAIHLYRSLANARLVVVPGAGHAIQREKPGLFLTALEDFLGSIRGAPTDSTHLPQRPGN